jgi:Coenzyme PQQ synthesis protein D (PqqD)
MLAEWRSGGPQRPDQNRSDVPLILFGRSIPGGRHLAGLGLRTTLPVGGVGGAHVEHLHCRCGPDDSGDGGSTLQRLATGDPRGRAFIGHSLPLTQRVPTIAVAPHAVRKHDHALIEHDWYDLAMQGDSVIGPPHPHVLAEDVAEDVMLYDTDHETFISLNSTAGDVWRLSSGEFTLQEIIDRLASSYQMATADISDEVAAIVDDLVDAGLLQTQPPR